MQISSILFRAITSLSVLLIIHSTLNPLYTGDSLMSSLTNSEDPDEMLLNGAFYPGLHCLLRHTLQRKKYKFYLEIVTCESSIYTMDYPMLIV